MSKAIIRSRPRPSNPTYIAILSEVDTNEWHVEIGKEVTLLDPSPQGMKVIGDVYECTLKSQDTCEVIRFLEHGTLAKGKVTKAAAEGVDGRVIIDVPGYPNPFKIAKDDELRFVKDIDAKLGDLVECLPTGKTLPFCDVVSVLVPA